MIKRGNQYAINIGILMATLRDYFDTDNPVFREHAEWEINLPVESLSVIAKMHYDLISSNAKYWSVYIPSNTAPLDVIISLIKTSPLKTGKFPTEATSIIMEDATGQVVNKADSIFTNRVHFYVEDDISDSFRFLNQLARENGISSLFYSLGYVKNRSAKEKPLAFISHDSRDKDAVVRELASELSKNMCSVWYDEYSLNVGDNLHESIDRGLKDSKYCILVLSSNFFSNDGWGQAEFDSIYMREMLEKKDIILPVWHEVSREDVYQYNAVLTNKVGISTDLGVKEVARQLAIKLKAI